MPPDERAAYELRIAETLQRAAETSARTDAWRAEREADGSAAEERHQERMRRAEEAAEERRRQAEQQAAPLVQGRRWVEGIIDQHVEPVIKATGIHVAKVRKQLGDEMVALAKEAGANDAATENRLAGRIADLEKRVERDGEASVQLLTELERRVAELEARAVLQPVKPRLVSGGDNG